MNFQGSIWFVHQSVSPSAKFACTLRLRVNYLEEDKISQLPDEILISMLSRLTLKEAARSSVLSRRWETLDDMARGTGFLTDESLKFISWVNQVLKSHQGRTIDEFRVPFHMNELFSPDLDRWIKFVMKRRVQRLELGVPLGINYCESEQYPFPLSPLEVSGFNSLTDLRLNFVDVTGEVLEQFLYNCKFLERLCIVHSNYLVNLKVSGLSLKLKNLEISKCFHIECIDISAVNLVSFKYIGPEISLPFKNFPSLVEALFGGDFCKFVTDNFCQLSVYLTWLETLKLHRNFMQGTEVFNFPVLSNLKHLELNLYETDDQNLLCFTTLIKASPFLHKFVLQLKGIVPYLRRGVRKPEKCPHQCLKVVELLGFIARCNDVEIAMYIVENAVSLEKIVFDTREPSSVGKPWQFDNVGEQEYGRYCARKLGAKLPPGAKLIII